MSFSRTLFRFSLPYRRPLLITVISMVLLVGVQLFAPWFIRALIAAVRTGETEALSSGLITRLAL